MSEKWRPELKVCGMRDAVNIAELSALNPDYMGFIFYPGSPRVVPETLAGELDGILPEGIRRVGVFVDSQAEFILGMAGLFGLHVLQLHGDESPGFCRGLREAGFAGKIWKAFQVSSDFDFSATQSYSEAADMFLFDSASASKGGSGSSFDWQLLEKYRGKTPFILAGGIGEDNIEKIKSPVFNNLPLAGVDINSRAEVSPGIKSFEYVQRVKEKMHGLYS